MHYDYKKQLRSFGYAWKGIRSCVGKEQNLSFHLITTVCVVTAGWCFCITRGEWIAIVLCIGMVIAAELFNSAIERLEDVKDIAAGAVLVCALAAIVVGLIIFIPYLTRFFL